MAVTKITIPLDDGSCIECRISSSQNFPVTIVEEREAMENGEARVQIIEGGSYEYQLLSAYQFRPSPKVIITSSVNPGGGRITPNTYVGTLSLEIIGIDSGLNRGMLLLEVCSTKTDYRSDYRYMLEDIAIKCAEMLLQYTSPAFQHLTPDSQHIARAIYQRFAFVKAILGSPDFTEGVYRIRDNSVTRWTHTEERLNMQKSRRMNGAMVKQLGRAPNRIKIPGDHPLESILPSIPRILIGQGKTETVDTPENRFVKYALNEFLRFCSNAQDKFDPKSRAYRESVQLESILGNMLDHPVFKEVAEPSLLALNSPVLQRKEGYREVLNAWLTFKLAAKLSWKGGEDVYDAGKRDVATLYEYWAFLVLLDIFCKVFAVDQAGIEQIIGPTKDGLGLQLKKGSSLALTGSYVTSGRKLHAVLAYNRTFSGKKKYPHDGSWTARMRPDYTLSIWPHGMTSQQAEKEELIVHLHFDAKYRIHHISYNKDREPLIDQSEEEQDTRRGTFKREDLLKMHAYKDAIRRTAGAYILYPGDANYQEVAFYELLPGIGVFPLHPSRGDNGIAYLGRFIKEVADHVLDYASHREKLAYRIFEIHQKKDRLPLMTVPADYDQFRRREPPGEIKVLVGYCKNGEQYEWIKKNGLYNIRIGSGRGVLDLTPDLLAVKYILIHGEGRPITSDMNKVQEIPPGVLSKNRLDELSYPGAGHDLYLVYRLEKGALNVFDNARFDIRKLEQYKTNRSSALPIVVSLSELMTVKV